MRALLTLLSTSLSTFAIFSLMSACFVYGCLFVGLPSVHFCAAVECFGRLIAAVVAMYLTVVRWLLSYWLKVQVLMLRCAFCLCSVV